MPQEPTALSARKHRFRFGIHAKIGLILLALAVYFAQQTCIRVSHENIRERRIDYCKRSNTPIRLAFIYPDYLKEQFLAGAELAVDLANENARINHLRPVTWDFFPESLDTVLEATTKISRNPKYFGVVGFYHSQIAVNALAVLEQNHVVTIFSSIYSSRIMTRDFTCIFSTGVTTDEMGREIIPSLRRILPPARFESPRPIQLAIIRSSSIYSTDICISLYADIAKNNAKLQLLSACEASPESTLQQLLDSEKISHQQYAIVTEELGGPSEADEPPASMKASSLAGRIKRGALQLDAVADITYKPGKSNPFVIASELTKRNPDVIFFATTPKIALPLIAQLRNEHNTRIPIIAPAGFEDIKELEPYREFLTNLYVLTDYDEAIQGRALREVAETAARLHPSKYKDFTPDSIGAEAYQAVALLLQACQLYPEYYPESIASALRYARPEGWGILGQPFTVTSSQTFDNHLPMSLKKYENGRFINVPNKQENQ